MNHPAIQNDLVRLRAIACSLRSLRSLPGEKPLQNIHQHIYSRAGKICQNKGEKLLRDFEAGEHEQR